MYKSMQCFVLLLPLFCNAISDEKHFEIRRSVRQTETQTIKSNIAKFDAKKSLSNQTSNGDEKKYSDLRGSFNKALSHQSSGYADPNAFQSLVLALTSERVEDFNNILIGTGTVKLANPQACLAYSLAANDSWINYIRPAPQFASAETAGEMVEVYWTALIRDVPFNEFDTNGTVGSAVSELNTLSDFRGPKVGGLVTRGTFLRGNTPGDLTGPYISQFLFQPIPYGAITLNPEQEVPLAGTSNDFLTTFNDWYTVINGGSTGDSVTFDGTPHFIRTPRDLCEFVHRDYPGQAFLNAVLLLNSYGAAALDPNNPYLSNETQDAFVTYGIGQILEYFAEAVQEGLKTAWYQKWQVNRRCRPEEFGFYVQEQKANSQPLGIHSDLINSSALTNIFGTFGSYFLPQAFPEGCPTHPSYPAGHGLISGACATIIKAFFNEDYEIQNPLQPNAANTALEAYGGMVKVGDELNKLASNISLGRDHAGVHYRSDGIEGLLLGEQVAIDILNNSGFLGNENFSGFSLTKFDGTKVIVGRKRS